jgi:hypothetical protein
LVSVYYVGMLGSLFRFVQYGPGDLIFQEGDPGDAFYIIVRGKCRVTAKSAHNTVSFTATHDRFHWTFSIILCWWQTGSILE